MKKPHIALLALLAAPVQLLAAPPITAAITTPAEPTMYVTGQALMQSCAEAEKAADGAAYEVTGAVECSAYLRGALDQQTQMYTALGQRPAICVPVNVTKDQLAVVFMRYARANVDDQKYIATELVVAAMTAAYPCPNKLTGP